MSRHSAVGPPRSWKRRGLEWGPALLLLAAFGLLHAGPALWSPTTVALGSDSSEAPAHLWATWAHLVDLADMPFVVHAPAGWPEGWVQPVTNPSNGLLTVPVWWLLGGGLPGVALGWNLLVVGAPLLQGLGLAWLLGLLHPDASSWERAVLRALGAICGAGAAHWLTWPWTGRSEFFAAALFPWTLGLLWKALRSSRSPEARWSALAAGLLLGLGVLGGPYLGPFLSLVTPACAGVLAWRAVRAGSSWVRVGGVLTTTAVVGGLMAAPLAWMLLTNDFPGIDGTGGARSSVSARELAVGLRLLAPLDAVSPGRDLIVWADGRAQSVLIPGTLALMLGVLGVRRGAGWLLAALWVVLLGLGPRVMIGGGLELHLVPWLAEQVLSPFAFVHNWSRMGCLVAVPVGLAAAQGVGVLLKARKGHWLGIAAVAAVGIEALSIPGPPLTLRPVVETGPPAVIVEAVAELPEGAMLLLPVWGVPRTSVGGPPRRSQLWALATGRESTATSGIEGDALLDESLVVRADVIGRVKGGSSLPEVACAWGDLAALRERGLAIVVMDWSVERQRSTTRWFEAVLGSPVIEEGGFAVYDLSTLPDGQSCALPRLPRALQSLVRPPG